MDWRRFQGIDEGIFSCIDYILEPNCSFQVYLAAVAGYLPSRMVRCIATFIDVYYIVRRNAISMPVLECFNQLVKKFQELRDIFITSGVRTSISLPRQHGLPHFYSGIQLFGAPNGLCSSLTESKHIKVVKEPWRRSSRFRALVQMLRVIIRMEKMAALRRSLMKNGLLKGSTTSAYVNNPLSADSDSTEEDGAGDSDLDSTDDEDNVNAECLPVHGEPVDASLTEVKLAATIREHTQLNYGLVLITVSSKQNEAIRNPSRVLRIISIVQTLLSHCDNSFIYMIIQTLTCSIFLMLLNAPHFWEKFMFITLRLQGFMHQVISAERVDCNSNASARLHPSMVLHAMIRSLLCSTNQNLV